MGESKYWIRGEHGMIRAVSLLEWAEWFEDADRHIAFTEIADGVYVSTVFLGFDHRLSGRGLPILWETMIFGGFHDQFQARYSSESEALKGHRSAVEVASLASTPN